MIVKISILVHFTRFFIVCFLFQDVIKTKKESLCKLHCEDMLRRKYAVCSYSKSFCECEAKNKIGKNGIKKKREKKGK